MLGDFNLLPFVSEYLPRRLDGDKTLINLVRGCWIGSKGGSHITVGPA